MRGVVGGGPTLQCIGSVNSAFRGRGMSIRKTGGLLAAKHVCMSHGVTSEPARWNFTEVLPPPHQKNFKLCGEIPSKNSKVVIWPLLP